MNKLGLACALFGAPLLLAAACASSDSASQPLVCPDAGAGHNLSAYEYPSGSCTSGTGSCTVVLDGTGCEVGASYLAPTMTYDCSCPSGTWSCDFVTATDIPTCNKPDAASTAGDPAGG